MTTQLVPNTQNIILDQGDKSLLFASGKSQSFTPQENITVPANTSLIYLIAYQQPLIRSITLNLSGEYAQGQFLGYVLAKDNHHINLSTIISHHAPHTSGDCLIKGILSDASQVTLQGMIQIHAQASNSQDQLTERLLVLGHQAVGELRPELEILNHDVKASHATTISHVDQEQLWYLQSRALSQSQATDLLISGFLHEVIAKIQQLPNSDQILKHINLGKEN